MSPRNQRQLQRHRRRKLSRLCNRVIGDINQGGVGEICARGIDNDNRIVEGGRGKDNAPEVTAPTAEAT